MRPENWDVPFQFSGGMSKGLWCYGDWPADPKNSHRDEPTTALDCCHYAASNFNLLKEVQVKRQDVFGIDTTIGECRQDGDDVAVMYAGKVLKRRKSESSLSRVSIPGLQNALPVDRGIEKKLEQSRVRRQISVVHLLGWATYAGASAYEDLWKVSTQKFNDAEKSILHPPVWLHSSSSS